VYQNQGIDRLSRAARLHKFTPLLLERGKSAFLPPAKAQRLLDNPDERLPDFSNTSASEASEASEVEELASLSSSSSEEEPDNRNAKVIHPKLARLGAPALKKIAKRLNIPVVPGRSPTEWRNVICANPKFEKHPDRYIFMASSSCSPEEARAQPLQKRRKTNLKVATKTCIKCHACKPATSFRKKRKQCKACQAAKQREYHQKNKEKIAARQREYRQKKKLLDKKSHEGKVWLPYGNSQTFEVAACNPDHVGPWEGVLESCTVT